MIRIHTAFSFLYGIHTALLRKVKVACCFLFGDGENIRHGDEERVSARSRMSCCMYGRRYRPPRRPSLMKPPDTKMLDFEGNTISDTASSASSAVSLYVWRIRILVILAVFGSKSCAWGCVAGQVRYSVRLASYSRTFRSRTIYEGNSNNRPTYYSNIFKATAASKCRRRPLSLALSHPGIVLRTKRSAG
jgi:hypothetical protein